MRDKDVFDITSRIETRTDRESFFAADRSVGVTLGALSLTATQVSAGTLVGAVGLHYLIGVAFLWSWVGIWLGWLFVVLFVGPQLRERGGLTVSDFLAARFTDEYQSVRGLSAGIIALVYLVFVTAQYVAGGVIMEGMFGVERWVSAVGLAVLALSYTAWGGMRTSMTTDALQVVAMVVGLLAAVVVGVDRVGGIGRLREELVAVDPGLLAAVNAPVEVAGFAVAFGLGIVVAPFELSRMYAMRAPDTVRRAIPIAVGIQLVIAACIALLGLVARLRFGDLPTPDAAVPRLALVLFGPLAGGLLVVAVLAAILSTTDSILIVVASAVAHDLYAQTLPELGVVTDPDEEDVLRVARTTVAVTAAVPVVLAVRPGLLGGLVQVIIALASALLAGALFVPVLAGLYWPRATVGGALAGMAGGVVGVAGWHFLTLPGSTFVTFASVDPVVPGVVVSGILTAVGSLATVGE